MKSKRHRNPMHRGIGYEPAFKKSVILYAEQKGNSEARRRYGISEETIRRWRKLKREIMEMAQQCVRRSQRHLYPTKEQGDKGGDKETDSTKTDLDSMPLQQRLSQNHNEQLPSAPIQEPVLQSQPISPTKLKVTRQGAKPQQPPPKPPTPPPQNPEVCLRWNSHHTNMQSAFPSLLTKEQYVDATLVSEGKTLKCHRMILSSCSPYFEAVLDGIGPFQHPVLFMKDTPFWILKALCDFMYAGEVHIFQDKLQELLNVAESLKIKGLAGNSEAKEDLKPIAPAIKQEVDVAPPLRSLEKPLKLEKEDESSTAVKPTRHEAARPNKKKEDKKLKHSAPKEKEKIPEEPPPKVVPKVNAKVISPKVAPKVVLPKLQSTSKTTVKNVLQKVAKPSTSKATHASRKSDASRRSDKHKIDGAAQKEKEKDKSPLKKDNINDPLDLLEPVYEEIAKEDPPPMMKCINPARLRERGNVPLRKGVNKKLKKRRYAEYADEEREESPPPVFSSRKGTRSRPHVKIPKFFHTHYDETQKETTDATIVREPHTDQSDPLIGVTLEEIKAEPVDVEENTIEMENYLQDHEMTSQEGEEIIGNYDSPIVNIKREVLKSNTPNIFRKMLDPQPVILNVHTVTEEAPAEVRLLNIHDDTLKIVDISKISTGGSGPNPVEETILGTTDTFDTIDNTREKSSEFRISNVQSMANTYEDNRLKESERPLENCAESNNVSLHQMKPDLRRETLNTSHAIYESEAGLTEENQHVLRIKIENIQSDSQDGAQVENNTDLQSTAEGIQDQPAISSLASLEARLGAVGIGNETLDSQRNQNFDPVHVSRTDGDTFSGAEPMELTENESQGVMPRDSDLRLGTCEASFSAEDPFTQKGSAENTSEACVDADSDNTVQQCEQIVPESSAEPVTLEPVQKTEDESVEMMSIGDASQEKEPETCGDLPRTAEEIPHSDLVFVGQDTLPNSREAEAVENVINATVQDSEVPNEVQRTDTHKNEVTKFKDNLQNTPEMMDSESQNTEQGVAEIALAAQESQVRDEVRIGETETLDVSVNNEEAQESLLNSVLNKQDENIKNPADESSENIEEELKQCLASTSHIASEKLDEEKFRFNTKRLSFDDDEDFTKDIEFDNFIGRNRPSNYLGGDYEDDFEMEATKNQSSEAAHAESEHKETYSETTEKEESAGDKVTVNEAGHVESEREKAYNETTGEEETAEPGHIEIERKEAYSEPLKEKEAAGDKVVVSEAGHVQSECKEAYSETTGEEETAGDKVTVNEPEHVESERKEAYSETPKEKEAAGDKVVVNDAGYVQSERREAYSESTKEEETAGDRVIVNEAGPVKTQPKEAYSESTKKEEASGDRMVVNEADCDNKGSACYTVNPNKNVPEITDNFKADHDLTEEQKLEDSLLADLDDDIEMKDATTSEQSDDGAEKTLEMIVNDLNESLGEFRK